MALLSGKTAVITGGAQGLGLAIAQRFVDEGARVVLGDVNLEATQAAAAKVFCTEMAGKVADLAVQIHGGSGYMREVPVERIYRDVRLLRLYEGTSEIQRLIIGGNLVKAAQRKH